MAYINNTKLAELGCPINGAHISNFVQKVTNRFDFYKKTNHKYAVIRIVQCDLFNGKTIKGKFFKGG